MLIGEVGLKTRSMFRKRSGRPRSWTSAASETAIAPAARSLRRARASRGRPLSSAPAARIEDAPASPPANR